MRNRLLQVSDLRKGYRLGENRVFVLEGLTLHVMAGEMVVLMGPSGSGKTTLLNCVSGIDEPDSGSVHVAGHPVDYSSERERTALRRHHIGMIFQFFNLIPTLTVEENVELPLLIAGNHDDRQRLRSRRLLAEVGMEMRGKHLPYQLSGGEMQLVSIARALVHEPDLLLADEPTGNVNPQIGRSIMRILRDASKREAAGVLMVTHSPEHAAWADRVCFLKEGVIADELVHGGNAENPGPIHEKLLQLGI
jgi:putative ABC transport system ATP-binding protein